MKALPKRLSAPLAIAGVSLALVAVYFIVVRAGSSAPPAATIGGPFRLVTQDGRTVTEADFKGEPKLVVFGYTHCPNVCPTILFEMSQAFEKLGPDKRIAGLFITIDPERDTPAVMKKFLSHFDPRIVGLSGTRAVIDRVMKEYHVDWQKVPSGAGHYSMDHSATVYLLNKKGRFVSSFNLDQPAAAAARQLQAYL